MGLIDLIPLAFSGVAVWIFYLLCSRIPKKPANAYLALLMLAMSLAIFWLISIRNELYLTDRYLLFLPITWSSGIGAISFLYLRAILFNRTRLRWTDAFFFIPLLIQIGFHTYWYIQPFEVKLDFFRTSYLPNIMAYEHAIAAFFCIIPLDITAFVMTMKFTKKNWNLVNKRSKPILVWARSLSILFLVRSTALSINVILLLAKVTDIQTEVVYEIVVVMLLIILWLAYYVYQHPAITMGYIKYAEASEKNGLFERKLEKMVEERIYDAGLGPHPIAELSELMEVEANFLGKYFKIHMNTNYPGYVRKLRMQKFHDLVEEAEKNGAELQVNLLQQQCGYRNRSSFHRDVKDVFDTSPSEYVENKLMKQQV